MFKCFNENVDLLLLILLLLLLLLLLKGNCFVVASGGCAPRAALAFANWPVAQQAANCDAAHRKAQPQNKRLVPPTQDNTIGICKFMAAYTQVGRMAQHRPQRRIKIQV